MYGIVVSSIFGFYYRDFFDSLDEALFVGENFLKFYNCIHPGHVKECFVFVANEVGEYDNEYDSPILSTQILKDFLKENKK